MANSGAHPAILRAIGLVRYRLKRATTLGIGSEGFGSSAYVMETCRAAPSKSLDKGSKAIEIRAPDGAPSHGAGTRAAVRMESSASIVRGVQHVSSLSRESKPR
jgi:hypothetical protein